VKIIKIVLSISFLFFSNYIIGQSENPISKFEDVLGKTNSETLTFLVSDFENNFLITNYPNLSTQNAYEKFLLEISQGNTSYLDKISKESKLTFKNSQLNNEIYYYRDSVWFDNEKLKERFVYKVTNGEKEYITKEVHQKEFMLKIKKDSLIQLMLESPRDYKSYGKYMNALNLIKLGDSFIENYCSDKEVGFLIPELTAKWVLEYKLDYTNYFHKRIVLLEFVY